MVVQLTELPRPCAATLTSDTTYNKPFKLPCASHTPPFSRPLYSGLSKVRSSFDGQNFFRFINWPRYNPWQSFFHSTESFRNCYIVPSLWNFKTNCCKQKRFLRLNIFEDIHRINWNTFAVLTKDAKTKRNFWSKFLYVLGKYVPLWTWIKRNYPNFNENM